MVRICRKCGAHFDGRQCKACKKASDAAGRLKRMSADPEWRTKERARNAKYRSENQDKVRASQAKYAAKNSEKITAKVAAWQAANPQKMREAAARYRLNNPEKYLASQKRWRDGNPEKLKAMYSAWAAANPEKRRLGEHVRRARKRACGGRLSVGLAEKLFKLQRGKCACGCAQPLGDDYHLDHRMPLALGGTNTDDNIQLLRSLCNKQKSAKHPVEFMQQRGFLL